MLSSLLKMNSDVLALSPAFGPPVLLRYAVGSSDANQRQPVPNSNHVLFKSNEGASHVPPLAAAAASFTTCGTVHARKGHVFAPGFINRPCDSISIKFLLHVDGFRCALVRVGAEPSDSAKEKLKGEKRAND